MRHAPLAREAKTCRPPPAQLPPTSRPAPAHLPPISRQVGCVMRRKGIVKIALRKGAPLVPAYCFGHTELWTVVTDPVGILQVTSLTLPLTRTRTLTRARARARARALTLT